MHQAVHYSFPAPKLFVKRDNVMIEVTGTVDMRIENLPVEYPETDCDGNVISTRTVDEPYEVYRMTIEGGLVGDELFVDGFSAGHIQAAATSCVAPAPPQPVCGHVPLDCDYPYDDDEGEHEDDGGGGCSTGRGGAGLALAGLALVLARRRRG